MMWRPLYACCIWGIIPRTVPARHQTMQTVKKTVCILMLLVLCDVLPHTLSQNLARGKPVQSYDVLGGYAAERAVDGEYLPSRTKCAVITAPTGSAPEWYVDLGDSYRVQTIRIYNTDEGTGNPARFTNFTLSVGTLSNRKACGPEFTGRVGAGDSIDISCNQTGNIVWLRKEPGNSRSYITLCEVEVYGLEQYDCNLCPPSVPCNGDTGCSQCQAWKTGPECRQDCPDGTHGVNCSATCGRCATGTTCDKVNGDCPDGCQLWFKDQRCQTWIKRPSVTNEMINVADITNHSAIVTWDPLYSVPSELALFYEYRVRYRERTMSYRDGPLVPHGTSPLSAQMTGLKHNTVYDFSIDTYRVMNNSRGPGDSYSLVSKKSKCNSPEPPQVRDVFTLNTNGTSANLGLIVLSYEALVLYDSGCDSYTNIFLDYLRLGDDVHSTVMGDLSQTVIIAKHVNSGDYSLSVRVENNEGLSASGPPSTVTIDQQREGPPSTITFHNTLNGRTTPTGSDQQREGSNKATGSTMMITVIVAVVILAGTVVLVTILVLRHKQTQSRGHDKEGESAYVNQFVSTRNENATSPQLNSAPMNNSSLERPEHEADYEDMSVETRNHEPQNKPYVELRNQAGNNEANDSAEYDEIELQTYNFRQQPT